MRCNKPTEVYSRVCGYHRPVNNWNKGKKEEFRQRRPFTLETRPANPELQEPHTLETR
jgi:hypothetical protein